ARGDKERGLTLHILNRRGSRAKPRGAAGIPVAYISRHALNRLYERGHDITEKTHATSIFAVISVLGYLTHLSGQHEDSGMNLLVTGLLVTGALHRCAKPARSGRVFEEMFFDVRTVLAADELGVAKQAQMAQGRIAAEVVAEWLSACDDPHLDERALAARIPYLPRREDSYPAMVRR